METFDQATDAGTLFLLLDAHDRTQIGTTIERLINMLDELEPDPDLEPSIGGWLMGGTAHGEREDDIDSHEGDNDTDAELSLGAPERHPVSWEYGFRRSGLLTHETGGRNSQVGWAGGNNMAGSDECEAVSEDEGADVQSQLHDAATWRETLDQTNLAANFSDDDEPDLGFNGIATGWRKGDAGEEGDGFVEGSDGEDMEPDHEGDERQTSNCPVAEYCVIAFRKPDGVVVREAVPC